MIKGCLRQNALLLSPTALQDNQQKFFIFLYLAGYVGRAEKPYYAKVFKIDARILTNTI